MEPDTTPRNLTPPTVCADCGEPLGSTRWRCPYCIRAAQRAVANAAPGQVVRPSDVAAARAQEDDAP